MNSVGRVDKLGIVQIALNHNNPVVEKVFSTRLEPLYMFCMDFETSLPISCKDFIQIIRCV